MKRDAFPDHAHIELTLVAAERLGGAVVRRLRGRWRARGPEGLFQLTGIDGAWDDAGNDVAERSGLLGRRLCGAISLLAGGRLLSGEAPPEP